MGNLRSFRRKLGGGAKRLPERLARKLVLSQSLRGMRLSRAERRKAGARQGNAG